MSVLLGIFLLFQSPSTITPEYEPRLDRTYYGAKTTATDEGEQSRRLHFTVSHAGKVRSGALSYNVSLELRQPARARWFDERLAAACGETQLFKRITSHMSSSFNAETNAVSVSLKQEEADPLTACKSPTLTVGGIQVRLSEKQMEPIRAAMEQAKK